MSIIREVPLKELFILTPQGELHASATQEEFSDFVEQECRKSFLKGEEEGEKRGYERGISEGRLFLNLLQTISQKLLDQKGRLLEKLKPEIIEFAISICERILRKELSQPEALIHLVSSLIDFVIASPSHESIQVYLTVEDLALLQKHLHLMRHKTAEGETIKYLADSLMRRGDCRIETKTGLLKYDISRELSDLQEKILGVH